ncbi:MAG: thioredoxin family protein, partial [Planctomycetes bacterium]|nr:thioredoxin family protein [Planctomycetota bacterium]
VLTRWGPTVLITAVLCVYVFTGRSSAPPPGWGSDFASALSEASSTDRKLVIAFYSEGCSPCAAMDRSVLGTPAVHAALAGFVPVRVNAWEERDLTARYGVPVTPTFVVADPVGNPLARVEGYHSVPEFVRFLSQSASLTSREASGAAIAPQVDP